MNHNQYESVFEQAFILVSLSTTPPEHNSRGHSPHSMLKNHIFMMAYQKSIKSEDFLLYCSRSAHGGSQFSVMNWYDRLKWRNKWSRHRAECHFV